MGFIFPPAKADKADDSKRGKHEVEDTGVQSAGRLFTHLLGRFCTHGTLGRSRAGRSQE